jgi:hypothetical protein
MHELTRPCAQRSPEDRRRPHGWLAIEPRALVPRIGRTATADHVNLVGSRVSVLHLVYDCLEYTSPVAVLIIHGKDADGRRRFI